MRKVEAVRQPLISALILSFCLPPWNSSNLLSPQPYQKVLRFHTHLATKWMSIPASGLCTMEPSAKMDRPVVYSPLMLLRTNPVCQWQRMLSESSEHYDTLE